MKFSIFFILFSFFSFTLAFNEWTWISGNNTVNIGGVYGTQGVPSTSNYPGSRQSMGFIIDSSGSIWIFGGVVGTLGE